MSNYLKLTKDKLDIEEISQLVTESTTGAVSIFVGTTRDHFEGKRVLTLEYEAYEAMAVKKMEDLCQLTRSKWPSIHNIAIYHRFVNLFNYLKGLKISFLAFFVLQIRHSWSQGGKCCDCPHLHTQTSKFLLQFEILSGLTCYPSFL